MEYKPLLVTNWEERKGKMDLKRSIARTSLAIKAMRDTESQA